MVCSLVSEAKQMRQFHELYGLNATESEIRVVGSLVLQLAGRFLFLRSRRAQQQPRGKQSQRDDD